MCTGEPSAARSAGSTAADYPRVYGGTAGHTWRNGADGGLSPCVRGNPYVEGAVRPHGRTIPVCTGEPRARAGSRGPCGDYPRVYGGTMKPKPSCPKDPGLSPCVRGNPCRGPGRHRALGLSPCVRGNLGQPVAVETQPGTIPVCTGEPACSGRGPTWRQDYPRVYGGTRPKSPMARRESGLSPCVRGNHDISPSVFIVRRTIPVCTGEP